MAADDDTEELVEDEEGGEVTLCMLWESLWTLKAAACRAPPGCRGDVGLMGSRPVGGWRWVCLPGLDGGEGGIVGVRV